MVDCDTMYYVVSDKIEQLKITNRQQRRSVRKFYKQYMGVPINKMELQLDPIV